MRARRFGAVFAAALPLIGCHKTPTAPEPSTLEFSVAPIPADQIQVVVPLGNLNPPGHTFPSDHAYLYHATGATIPVVAPAGGVVRSIQRGDDDKIMIQTTSTMEYYLAHLVLDSGIAQDMTITAGQQLGRLSTLALAMDIGVLNNDVNLFFITPGRYPQDTLHADSPLKYFSEPLRSTLYAKEQGSAANKDGKIDFDQPGKLAGNWFLEGLAVPDSPYPPAWPKHLAFVRDVADPSAIRISVGGTLSLTGVFGVTADAIDPANVTPASGAVLYTLTGTHAPVNQVGLMLVKMIDGSTVKVETFFEPPVTDFTAAAVTYVR